MPPRHRRQRKPIATRPGLPPLVRVLAGQALGITPGLAWGEVHRLPPPPRSREDDTTDAPLDDLPGRRDDPQACSGVLPAREVIHLMRQCRYSRSPRIPIACLAKAAGLSRETLYVAMNSGEASEEVCTALSPVLRAAAAGTLEFRRHGRQWEQVELMLPAGEPSGPPGWQDKIVRDGDWQPGRRCRSCGGCRYTRCTVHGAAMWLCNNCMPWQTAGIGARPA